jgi:hypothetical protein
MYGHSKVLYDYRYNIMNCNYNDILWYIVYLLKKICIDLFIYLLFCFVLFYLFIIINIYLFIHLFIYLFKFIYLFILAGL